MEDLKWLAILAALAVIGFAYLRLLGGGGEGNGA